MMTRKAVVGAALIAAAVQLSACGIAATDVAVPSPIELIQAGDAKACAHPEVVKTLVSVLTSVRGDEETYVPVDPAHISKLPLPPVSIELIRLTSVDPSVQRITCDAQSVMVADIGGPSQRFEKQISYVLTPSAQNESEFIVTTNTTIAADRINIGLVKEMAAGMQRADADAATQARIQEALLKAGSVPEPIQLAETVGSAPAHPSFDCAKASTHVERLICADSELADKDRQVSATYKTWIQRVKKGEMIDPIDEIVADQKAWLQRRNACTTAACVSEAYDDRIGELPTL